MKKLVYSVIVAAGVFFLSANASYAQFEGRILFDSYQVDSNGKKQNQDQFTMFVTPDRIMLQGENQYNFVGNIKTQGVLIRLDTGDFVFLTGKNEALKISSADIKAMMNMLGSNGKANTPPDVNYKQTGETRQIQGYVCEKFILRDEDQAGIRTEMWMTKDLDIKWGMLFDSWNDSQGMIGGDLPLHLMFENGYFPVRIESYRNGNRTGVMEATEITESNIARAMVQIPAGVQVLSFQDYLFQKMSRQ